MEESNIDTKVYYMSHMYVTKLFIVDESILFSKLFFFQVVCFVIHFN